MHIDIQPFKNTDTRQICSVWNQHQAASGLDHQINPLSLELCVLAKPYFEPKFFLVAEIRGRIVGFAHLGFCPVQNLEETDTQRAVLCCLCVESHPQDVRIAEELLSQVFALANSQNSSQIQTAPAAPNCPFYLGLAPGDGVMGVLEADVRMRNWLAAAGFEASDTITGWEVIMAQFHPPMDRLQIQIRRMAHVDRSLAEPTHPWWLACALGHADQVSFQLTMRKERKVVCEALFWTIDDEVSPRGESIARLWISDRTVDVQTDYYVFLLSEAIRQLFIDRVKIVRAFVASGDTHLSQILHRVGLVATQTGTVFSKQLAS